MIIWMLYSAGVALIIAAAARAAELLARLSGYRVRWVWAGALALTVFLSGSAAWRARANTATAPAAASIAVTGSPARISAAASWGDALLIRVEELRRSVAQPLRRAAAFVDSIASPAANVYAGLLAAAISLGLAFVFVGVDRRFRRARHDWPIVSIGGVDVRLAPRVGPLVIGVVRPEIVVPRWLLGRAAADQRLVVAHESEHVRAHDPLLLSLACSVAIVAPWNPAVWYMLSRLRLAIELDCDARVLRCGTVARSYGSLLIDVAQQASELRLSALALVDDASHLHQRILAMHGKAPRLARARSVLAAAFSLGAVLVVCQTSFPTRAELAQMGVAPATPMTTPTATRTTLAEAASPSAGESANALTMLGPRAKPPFTGLIFIDGVRSTLAELQTIQRARIDAIEVIKGPSAAQEFNDPAAAKGVITVKTKKVD